MSQLEEDIIKYNFQNVKDQSTIFSIVPFDIREFKPGIYPGQFNIDRCLDETKPERLLIDKPSKHAMMVGGKKDPIMIDTATYVLAQSVVDDFLSTILFTTPTAKPGLTWIQGNISTREFTNLEEYKRIKDQQKRWFLNVVKETDKEWVQSKHNVKVVSDIARYAVKCLSLDKEWAYDDVRAMEFIRCPACGTSNNPVVAVCSNCRCILNEEKYKSLKFAS